LLDPTRQILIQIDVEPLNASWTFPIDHVLLGDAGYVMDCLAEACDSRPRMSGEDGTSRAESARVAHGRVAVPRAGPDDVALVPQQIIEVLEEILPDDAVVTCDAGENRLFMMQWFRTAEGGEYLQPAAGGGMGYAVPAAMAARLATGDRVIVAVCGDGGFAMSIHALMTAIQENIPIAVVVFNNGALGWVLHGMGREAVAASFADFDHAEIARALGCDGVRVASADDLRTALKSVIDLRKSLVIDVPTSLSTSFMDVAQRFN
jgi:acetolactate synthase-1/2/3 large subunit